MGESDTTGKINNALLHKTKVLEKELEEMRELWKRVETCEEGNCWTIVQEIREKKNESETTEEKENASSVKVEEEKQEESAPNEDRSKERL